MAKSDNTFWNAWADAQAQMMQTWTDMTDTTVKAQSQFAEIWQGMAQQNSHAWTDKSDKTIQTVADKMLESQQGIQQMLKMAWQTWEKVMPVIAEDGDWQTALDDYVDKIREDMLNLPAMSMRGMNDMNALWKTYLDQWQGYLNPWTNAMQASQPLTGPAMMGDRNSLIEMTNLYWDAFQDTFGQLLQAPGLGSSRELDEKLRLGFAAWLDMQTASYEYQVVVANAWVESFKSLMEELVNQAEKGEQLSLRDFLNKWSGLADDIFKTTFASDAYVAAQSKLVNAMMSYRKRQRAVSEVVLQALDLPTRSEVDEAHRRIYELRKEIKALQKTVVEMQGSTSPAKAPAKKTTTRKSTPKKTDDSK